MEEEKKDVITQITEMNDMNFIEEMLKKNYFEFDFKDVKYRIKKPTLRMRNEANEKRLERYTELMNNKNYKFEEDLKREYLNKGVDVDVLVSRYNTLETKKNTLQIKLAEELKKESPDQTALVSLKEEVDSLQNKALEISFKRSSMLEFSIENQILIFAYSYLTYLMLEKEVTENVYEKAFKTYDEYLDGEEALINKAAFYSTFVLRNNE